MRLINTTTGEFREFYDEQVPRYAILSHRWSTDPNDEVTFKEYSKGRGKDKPGQDKIIRFCSVAAQDGLEWAWVDTCCIDKRSSAELTEAINSMFKWYRNARYCYVYLNDCVDASAWRKSAWWTRGWTLQELIAPSRLAFYDREWRVSGDRADMAVEIEQLVGIPKDVLVGARLTSYRDYSVAQKMSWAARRCTSRVEDRAYSLLGLFDVNMPLLYGEGTKAFERLQLEILQKHADESLFAWRPDPAMAGRAQFLLAQSPSSFADCGDMAPLHHGRRDNLLSASFFRLKHPLRRTAWGIECEAEVRDLQPSAKGVRQLDGSKLAFTLRTIWEKGMRWLPCTIVLERSRYQLSCYKRLECHHMPLDACLDMLRQRFIVGKGKIVTIFLQYDAEDDDYHLRVPPR